MELKVDVPTYYGDSAWAPAGERPEFGQPFVSTVVRPAGRLRIVLGSNDYFDDDAPDVQIERRPNGWMIFLRPVGGGEASGQVIFLDDGRSFLIPERHVSSTPPTVALDPGAEVAALDETKTRRTTD